MDLIPVSYLKQYDIDMIKMRYGTFIEHINKLLRGRNCNSPHIITISSYDNFDWHKTGVYNVIYDCAIRGSEGCSQQSVEKSLGQYFKDNGYSLRIGLDEYMNNWKDSGYYSIDITW